MTCFIFDLGKRLSLHRKVYKGTSWKIYMKITFNKHASVKDMNLLKEHLHQHTSSRNVVNEIKLDIKKKILHFEKALTHEEDTFILSLLMGYSHIILSIADNIQPE